MGRGPPLQPQTPEMQSVSCRQGAQLATLEQVRGWPAVRHISVAPPLQPQTCEVQSLSPQQLAPAACVQVCE